jgi:hypothetical protein
MEEAILSLAILSLGKEERNWLKHCHHHPLSPRPLPSIPSQRDAFIQLIVPRTFLPLSISHYSINAPSQSFPIIFYREISWAFIIGREEMPMAMEEGKASLARCRKTICFMLLAEAEPKSDILSRVNFAVTSLQCSFGCSGRSWPRLSRHTI